MFSEMEQLPSSSGLSRLLQTDTAQSVRISGVASESQQEIRPGHSLPTSAELRTRMTTKQKDSDDAPWR